MANPFEQFGGGNPFAQFGSSADAEPEQGIASKAKDIASNVGMGALNGAAQIGTTLLTPMDWMLKKAGVSIPYLSQQDRRGAIGDFMKQNADPNSLAFKAGELGSEIAGTSGIGSALATGAKAIPFVANTLPKLIPALESSGFSLGSNVASKTLPEAAGNLLTRIGAGAVNGGLTAGLINPSDAGAGAAIGAVMPPVAQGIGKVGSAVGSAFRPIFNPEGSALSTVANMVGDTAPAFRKPAGPLSPTADQLTSNPGVAATAKAVFNTPTGKIAQAQRELENNQKAWGIIKGVAGSDDALTNAIAARRANSEAFWNQAGNPKVDVSDLIKQISNLQSTGLGARPTVRGALKDISNTLSESSIEKDGAHYANADLVDALRQNVNDYLRKHAPLGAVSNQETKALAPLTDSITNLLDSQVSGYKNYLAQYTKDSVPINTMQLGRNMQDRLWRQAAGLDEVPKITPQTYRNTLATQLKQQKFGIDPDAKQSLLDLASSYKQQQAGASALKTSGSDTALNLGLLGNLLYGKNMTPTSAGSEALGVLGAHFGIPGAVVGKTVGKGFDWALNKGADRTLNSLTDLLMNPELLQQGLAAKAASGPGAMTGLLPFVQRGVVASQVGQNTP